MTTVTRTLFRELHAHFQAYDPLCTIYRGVSSVDHKLITTLGRIKLKTGDTYQSVERKVIKKYLALVIGRVKDLQKLNKGEKSLLDRLPDQGSPKANWKQNSGVLRQEMGNGKPIRDASPGDTTGQFLNAERNLLESRGWTFDKSTSFWNPPK